MDRKNKKKKKNDTRMTWKNKNHEHPHHHRSPRTDHFHCFSILAFRCFHTSISDRIAHPMPTNSIEIINGVWEGPVFTSAETLAGAGLSVAPNTAEILAMKVGVGVRVDVGFIVGVGVFVGVGVAVFVGTGVGVGVLVGWGVGVGVGPVTAMVVSVLQVGELQLDVYLPTLNK